MAIDAKERMERTRLGSRRPRRYVARAIVKLPKKKRGLLLRDRVHEEREKERHQVRFWSTRRKSTVPEQKAGEEAETVTATEDPGSWLCVRVSV